MKRLFLVTLVCLSFLDYGQSLFDEKALLRNLKTLSADSLEGRKAGGKGGAMARSYIQEQFRKLNLEPLTDIHYENSFEFSERGTKIKGVNLLGVLKGKNESAKSIVASAHYDHEGVKNGKIYNGADDNASGVSALLAIAEYFQKHKPQHNIIFIAFDAEEEGLQGSKAFVKTTQLLDQILVNVNLDMVARADNHELVACGTFFSPQLKPLVERVKPEGDVKIMFGHDDPSKYKGEENWTNSSDHGSFHSAKIPFIYFGVADHADYHRPSDDYDKVNPATFISTTKLIVKTLVEIDGGLK